MSKNTMFLDRLNWLYEHDYEEFKIIEAVIEAVHGNRIIAISKDLNTVTPRLSISIEEYIYKHQCSSEEKANRLIDLITELNNQIKKAG
ncbi:MAG: hypothetical protein RR942_13855 [Romboutsia sp.]